MKYLLIILFSLFEILKAHALTIVPPDIKDVAKNAEQISIVNILNRTSIVIDDGKFCGWLLDLEVDVEIRGNKKNIKIFTYDYENLMENTDRLFVLLGERDKATKRPDGSCIETHESAHEIDYFVGKHPLSIMPIDKYLLEKTGGDWLMHSWLPHESAYTQFVDYNENPYHPDAYMGLYLLDILKNNWELLRTPK